MLSLDCVWGRGSVCVYLVCRWCMPLGFIMGLGQISCLFSIYYQKVISPCNKGIYHLGTLRKITLKISDIVLNV